MSNTTTSDPIKAKPNAVLQGLSNAVGKMRADEDMFALLTTFGELDPIAIENADVTLARSNPSIADAVRRQLEKAGRDISPESLVPGVTTHDSSIA